MVSNGARVSRKVKELPPKPGVYKFLDSRGKVIYVGKAINLKKRVSSYFRRGKALEGRISMLVAEISDIEHIVASSEAEALIFEAGLIKDHRPKYNIDLKDDKSYPFLKLTVNEKYPRLFTTRRRLNDGALYYGPYTDLKLLKEAAAYMKKLFPLRSCKALRKRVCLEYHLGQCCAPCEGKVSVDDYSVITDRTRRFLEGKKDDLIRTLEHDMRMYSKKRSYEKAIEARNALRALTAVRQFNDMARYPVHGELEEMRSFLQMRDLPNVIECFDVSNISGGFAVGAMVRFTSGVPSKKDYRKFRIKKVEGIDDYAMIKEIVGRRYGRIKKENGVFPDLVIIDGGKGHLSAACREIQEIGITGVKVISIAKEHNHIYVEDRERPLRLSPGSSLLFLIQRIRDEAHRFAITYHRHLRNKGAFISEKK